MTRKKNSKNQKRLCEIEDRKIEILMEIAKINDNYNEQVTRLNSEYTRLDKEYYELRSEMIRSKQKE